MMGNQIKTVCLKRERLSLYQCIRVEAICQAMALTDELDTVRDEVCRENVHSSGSLLSKINNNRMQFGGAD